MASELSEKEKAIIDESVEGVSETSITADSRGLIPNDVFL